MEDLTVAGAASTVALGALLGFFGGMFGIGGGIIAIPLLAGVFGMEQSLAQGTALVMMAPNLLLGWWRYQRRHPVPGKSMAVVALGGTLATWGLAHFATRLEPDVLRWLFCLFLIVLAGSLLLRQARQPSAAAVVATGGARLWLVGMLGGCAMGLLGVGGGLVATPLLTLWLGMRQTVAQSLSLALVAPSSLVALATYGQAGRVDWPLGAFLALGGLSTVAAGVAFAHRLPERKMRRAFAWMLLLTATWLGLGSLF